MPFLTTLTQRLNRVRNLLARRNTRISTGVPISYPVLLFHEGHNSHLSLEPNLLPLYVAAKLENVVTRGFEVTLSRERARDPQLDTNRPTGRSPEQHYEEEKEAYESDQERYSPSWFSCFYSSYDTSYSRSFSSLRRWQGPTASRGNPADETVIRYCRGKPSRESSSFCSIL